jgi:hypothetical protein
MKFLSSIFSSETLRSIELPRHWIASMALLAFLLVGAELAARFLMAPIGENVWAYSPSNSYRAFEWYRYRSETGNTPRVVAIGDSTGARNFDPESAADSFGDQDIYSLARAGNFPIALRSNTLPLLETGEPPEVVLLFQWAGSFRDDPRVRQIERGARSSLLEARQEGRWLVTDFLYLARLYPARSFLVRHWVAGKPLVTNADFGSFSPLQRSATSPPQATDGTVPEQDEVQFSDARRDVVLKLLEIAKERDIIVFAVVGPQRSPGKDRVTELHLQWLSDVRTANCANFEILDERDVAYLAAEHFKDNNHLYADGAARFSSDLAGRLVDMISVDPKSRCPRAEEPPAQTPLPAE